MYRVMLGTPTFRPAILLGVVLAALAVQLDPQSRSYVAYNTLIRARVPPRDAVLMTTLSLSIAYALGESRQGAACMGWCPVWVTVWGSGLERVARLGCLEAQAPQQCLSCPLALRNAHLHSLGHFGSPT
jgi:hypothetical protein